MDPSKLIDKQIAALPIGRQNVDQAPQDHSRCRARDSEDWKWNTAVFIHDGLVLALGAFKGSVEMNFSKVQVFQIAQALQRRARGQKTRGSTPRK